jgi:hypothetical protein
VTCPSGSARYVTSDPTFESSKRIDSSLGVTSLAKSNAASRMWARSPAAAHCMSKDTIPGTVVGDGEMALAKLP